MLHIKNLHLWIISVGGQLGTNYVITLQNNFNCNQLVTKKKKLYIIKSQRSLLVCGMLVITLRLLLHAFFPVKGLYAGYDNYSTDFFFF